MSVTVRMAVPADLPLIQDFHDTQNRRQGTTVALPKLFTAEGDFTRNIALAFMVERDGTPVQAFFFELVPEVCFAGCDPQATAYAQREIDRIAFLLRGMGFTGINCKVPDHLAKHIDGPLERAGFAPDTGLTHFFKDLRLQEKEVEG